MIADMYEVAEALGKTVPSGAVEEFQSMQRLVAMSRRYGGDAGMACLAGKWLGQGMPEHEIVARCWPQSRSRLEVVR